MIVTTRYVRKYYTDSSVHLFAKTGKIEANINKYRNHICNHCNWIEMPVRMFYFSVLPFTCLRRNVTPFCGLTPTYFHVKAKAKRVYVHSIFVMNNYLIDEFETHCLLDLFLEPTLTVRPISFRFFESRTLNVGVIIWNTVFLVIWLEYVCLFSVAGWI